MFEFVILGRETRCNPCKKHDSYWRSLSYLTNQQVLQVELPLWKDKTAKFFSFIVRRIGNYIFGWFIHKRARAYVSFKLWTTHYFALKVSIASWLFSSALIPCMCQKLILLFAEFSQSKSLSYRFPKVVNWAIIWCKTEQGRRMGSIRGWAYKSLCIGTFLWKERCKIVCDVKPASNPFPFIACS